MRHHVHLFMGSPLEAAAYEVPRYAMTNGVREVWPFVHSLLWSHSDEAGIEVTSVSLAGSPDNIFLGDAGQVKTEHVVLDDLSDEAIERFFKDLYRHTVTIDNPGQPANLLLTLTVPLWEELMVEDAVCLLQGLAKIELDYEVDVIGLDAELASLLPVGGQELSTDAFKSLNKQGWERLTDAARANAKGNIKHLIPLHDNNGQAALMIDQDGLVRILVQWSLLCAESYTLFFPPSFDPDHELTAIGFSVLHLDKSYFVRYLMAKAFVHVLERDNVTQQDVDVNKIAPIAGRCLQDGQLKRDFTRLFSSFWQNKVKPLIEGRFSHADIIARLSPELTQLFQHELFDALQDCIKDEQLSLPERKCVMSLVLGLDDKQLVGNIFNDKQLNIDDVVVEPLQLFVDQYNQEEDVSPSLQALADENGKLFIPTDTIRSLKGQMRDSTRYIRQQAQRLDTLKAQIENVKESKRRLTENGFLFEGQTYKLLTEIGEKTFDEDYQGHDQLPPAVDLRNGFTDIRNQGALGACSTFASVAAMEYIMKKNKQESDLSEAFVFYNARKSRGIENENAGTTIYDAITAMHDLGICIESLHPYDADSYTLPPTDEALEDALTRRVVTAKNIRLGDDIDRNVNAIKSAVADGFPVVFALNIYDSFDASFDSSRGFISRPTDDEVSEYYEKYGDERQYHAMVICGYSDEQRIFIVRNSWGTRFGDKGYCYLPYSYVGDKKLSIQHCIITEVRIPDGSTGTSTAPDEKQKHVQFDQTDALIDIAVTGILLDEERVRLKRMEDYYKRLHAAYRTLLNQLCNNNHRRAIAHNARNRLAAQVAAVDQQIAGLQNARSDELKTHDSNCLRTQMWIAIVAIVSGLITGTLAYWHSSIWPVLGMATVAIVAVGGLYYSNMHSKRKQTEHKYEEQINRWVDRKTQLQREHNVIEMKMHFAGIFIEQFEQMRDRLNAKYRCMCSFLGNLSTWYGELKQALGTMDSHAQIRTFISVLDNEQLDMYFDENAPSVTKDVRLASFFDDYKMDEGGITAFRANLEENLAASLLKLLHDFSLLRYITRAVSFPFLKEPEELSGILGTMSQRSAPFAHIQQIEAHTADVKYVMIHAASEQEQKSWRDTYRRFFSIAPNEAYIASPFQLVVLSTKNIALGQLR
ncbi:MAG: C1 family peptidase [Muribaculaceae bacterium]|nr:C1 family peptidase [Muribaculaceae bacterium]